MAGQAGSMPLVGKVIRNFNDLGCVGIQVSGDGFKKGDKLLFETNRETVTKTTITADSIQIDKQPVD